MGGSSLKIYVLVVCMMYLDVKSFGAAGVRKCHYNGASRVTRYPELMAIKGGFLACWQGHWGQGDGACVQGERQCSCEKQWDDGQGTGMSACHAEPSVFLFGGVYVRGSMLLKLLSNHLFPPLLI